MVEKGTESFIKLCEAGVTETTLNTIVRTAARLAGAELVAQNAKQNFYYHLDHLCDLYSQLIEALQDGS
jgi:hypothetical protein